MRRNTEKADEKEFVILVLDDNKVNRIVNINFAAIFALANPPKDLRINAMKNENLNVALENKGEGLIKEEFTVRIISANSPANALNNISGMKIDLVITDNDMPNTSERQFGNESGGGAGLDFIKELRSMPAYAHTPVIMVSGTATADQLNSLLLKVGGNKLIEKPVKQDELIQALIEHTKADYLNEAKAQEQLESYVKSKSEQSTQSSPANLGDSKKPEQPKRTSSSPGFFKPKNVEDAQNLQKEAAKNLRHRDSPSAKK